MTLEQRRAGQRYQDTQGLASRVLAGKDELVAKNMKTWPENYSITPAEMWADVLAQIARWMPYLEDTLESMLSEKEKGKETYYSFATGLMPIDEAIAWQEARIARGVQALSAGVPGEV